MSARHRLSSLITTSGGSAIHIGIVHHPRRSVARTSWNTLAHQPRPGPSTSFLQHWAPLAALSSTCVGLRLYPNHPDLSPLCPSIAERHPPYSFDSDPLHHSHRPPSQLSRIANPALTRDLHVTFLDTTLVPANSCAFSFPRLRKPTSWQITQRRQSPPWGIGHLIRPSAFNSRVGWVGWMSVVPVKTLQVTQASSKGYWHQRLHIPE